MKQAALRTILFALPHVIRHTARKHHKFADHLLRKNCVVQIKLKDGSVGRYFNFKGGKLRSKAGIHPNPDVKMVFKDLQIALRFMTQRASQAEIVHAAKNFKVVVEGRDELVIWFMRLLNELQTAGLSYGTRIDDETVRYTTTTNGGPLFVYVKNDRIVRLTPIDLEESDAPSWSIRARGRIFTPMRRATVSPHALSLKSTVYSDKRLLYPMRRVDFDPNGERNPQNRGISEYVRISWDEALDIVANEIKRQKRDHGPGAITIFHGAHHQWGNIGYWLSALLRFGNLIGFTRMSFSPISWEGWYWGAMHHFGNSLRLGLPGFYGTLEDCLKEAELIVFWSSDPEATHGVYGGAEGTSRRMWAKELGIDFVHIDPHCNETAQFLGGKWIPIKPGTDSALALAIMHVWIAEELYDKDYVANRTTGFEEWRDYLLGKDDGVPKTPEWQVSETGVPAKDVRSLARAWGSKKTYLAAGGLGVGFGGACRSATGIQWARSMILMMAMQGWGKPGINFGNLQFGTPLDLTFYFPGYADGGISGDFQWTASGIENYVSMAHVLTMNPVKQIIPREKLADGIIDGHCKGYLWDGSSPEAQFAPIEYPMPGYSPIHMMYRYGGSSFGTITDSGRLIDAYRHPSMEFVVNQSIWFEGETKFADIILPACTSLERWDIGEWAGGAGYLHHSQDQLNHRMIVLQHKCIGPLGESKSDYQIFLEILQRLELGAMFSEGCSELDWCKRIFESSDLPRAISWKEFLHKGYYVVPAPHESVRDPVYFRWYAEGRKKDVPEPHPIPAQHAEEFGMGLQMQSGKIEFVSRSLLRGDPDNPERPALNRYISSWEGPSSNKAQEYPLQLVSSHPRYSFHTHNDGKNSYVNDVRDHRVLVSGYYYWIVRISSEDAAARGISQHDLVKVFNDRGGVICAADISPLIAKGVVKAHESSAVFEPISQSGLVLDRGGCMNLLTPSRTQVPNTDAIAPNSCLVEIEKWIEMPEIAA